MAVICNIDHIKCEECRHYKQHAHDNQPACYATQEQIILDNMSLVKTRLDKNLKKDNIKLNAQEYESAMSYLIEQALTSTKEEKFNSDYKFWITHKYKAYSN